MSDLMETLWCSNLEPVSGTLSSSPSFATNQLCDCGQVT